MKERPILFTPDNVRAIREDRKTQTRRVIKPQPDKGCDGMSSELLTEAWLAGFVDAKCRYGEPGDRLYVKEGVIVFDGVNNANALVGYYMDGIRPTLRGHKRLTAMFMPKWAARFWLELTDVRVQRVQEISLEDALAEGIDPVVELLGGFKASDPVGAYKALWDSINGKTHPWSANPWVWAITFRRLP